MTKPYSEEDYQEAENRIRALLDKWVVLVGLGPWHFNVKYIRERIYGGDDSRKGSEAIFRISPRWMYQWAELECNMLAILEENDKDFLERCFIHELMHCFLAEVRPEEYDHRPDDAHWLVHEEHAAQALAQAFFWVDRKYLEQIQSLSSETSVEQETPGIVVGYNFPAHRGRGGDLHTGITEEEVQQDVPRRPQADTGETADGDLHAKQRRERVAKSGNRPIDHAHGPNCFCGQ